MAATATKQPRVIGMVRMSQVRGREAEETVERLLQAVADVHGSDDVHEMNS
jgi:hypothetical protein